MSSLRISTSNTAKSEWFSLPVRRHGFETCLLTSCCFFTGFLHDFGVIHRDVKVKTKKIVQWHKTYVKHRHLDHFRQHIFISRFFTGLSAVLSLLHHCERKFVPLFFTTLFEFNDVCGKLFTAALLRSHHLGHLTLLIGSFFFSHSAVDLL